MKTINIFIIILCIILLCIGYFIGKKKTEKKVMAQCNTTLEIIGDWLLNAEPVEDEEYAVIFDGEDGTKTFVNPETNDLEWRQIYFPMITIPPFWEIPEWVFEVKSKIDDINQHNKL